MDRLTLGVAYHSNRILRNVESDLRDIIAHGFDSVLHMLTHNDMDRHRKVMKEIVTMTREHGLDVWIDNWGLAGSPGDSSYFLGYNPDARQFFNDGTPRR